MLLALTQRVEVVKEYQEQRDCLDQRWHCLLNRYGHVGLPVPNQAASIVAWCEMTKIEGIILTGGNDISGQKNAEKVSVARESTERELLKYAANHRLPVLAICRGLQFLNLELGGKLSCAEGHIAVEHLIECGGNPYISVDKALVNSYHRYVITRTNLADDLVPWATTEDGFIEGASHREYPWIGIMWHPERAESILDAAIFKNLFE